MYSQRPDPSQWRKFDHRSVYASGWAYDRLRWLMRYDPYVSLFTEDTIAALCNLFLSTEVLRNEDFSIKEMSKAEVHIAVMNALNRSPLANLFAQKFKWHVVQLVLTALYSGDDKNGDILS